MNRNKPISIIEQWKRQCFNDGLSRAMIVVSKFGERYPTDIFPKPYPGCAPDLYSAAMARHLCEILPLEIAEHRLATQAATTQEDK